MAINQIQNTFTMGELDPLLLAKVDFEGYYKAARKLRNVLVIPQGGIRQRFGTVYIDKVIDRVTNTNITDETQIMFVVFQYSIDKSFLMVVRPDDSSDPIVDSDPVAIDIYLDGAIVATLDAGDGVPWEVSQIDDLRYVRASDRIIFLHKDTIPQQVVRGVDDATWTITPQAFVYYPTYDFSIKDGGALVYTGATVTFTPSATSGNVTITVANATPLTTNHVGGIYQGNGGILRITAVASTTSFSGFTLAPFANTNAIRGDLSFLREPTFGVGGGAVGSNPARGWPSVGSIFQNRLVYGNTPTLPNILCLSETFNYNSFDDSTADDNDGFSYLLGSDSLNEIRNIVSTTSLIAITNNSMFSTSTLIEVPLTPANAFLIEQSREGGNEVLAQVVDDQVLYVESNGVSVKTLSFDIIQSKLTTNDASLLSPHLVRTPREAASMANPFKFEGNYYLIVNSQDGSLAVYQTLKDQAVSAWTLQTTQGEFLDICSTGDEAYVLVKRQTGDALASGENKTVFQATPDFSRFTDITDDISQTSAVNVQLFPTDVDDSYIVFGNSCPFNNLNIILDTPSDVDILPVFEYLDKNGIWTVINDVVDSTLGFTQDGSISWFFDDVIDWAPMTVNDVENQFWMRIQDTATNITVYPVEEFVSVNLESVIYIEKLAFDYIPDCSIEASSDDMGVITGLNALAGRQVWLLQQTSSTYNLHAGICHGPYFVALDGSLLLPEQLYSTDFVVGVFSAPLIIAMPPVGQTQQGVNVYLPRLIQSLFIDFYQSAGIIVANREIPVLRVGGFSMDIPLTLKTGFWEISPYPERNARVEIPITTVQPLPFTIIGIGYKVDF